LLSGDFAVDVEVVRRECTERKCYDTTNFAAHFKNNGSLFDHTYTKDTKTLKLSEDGRKELADIVKELQ
jgi:hypothetical protein